MSALPSNRRVLIVSRYAGTADVLADLIRGDPPAGTDIQTGAVDRDGLASVQKRIADAGTHPSTVVVVTAAPGDPTLTLVTALIPGHRVVAVTWHPDDERPPVPPGATVVLAGAIVATLAQTVRGLVQPDR